MRKKLFSITLFIICAILFSFSISALEISAKSGVLLEAQSGEIVFGKNENTPLPMASTTKIMTAIVVIENENLSKTVKIQPQMTDIEGSSIYLHEGEELTVLELLYALLLESANDASVALAYTVCDSIEAFADLMNKKSLDIGLKNTHFTNPHGLDDENHFTTSYDLGILATYAMKNPTFAKIVSTHKMTIPLNNGEGTRVLINHNRLLRSYNGAIGIKTGFTKKCGRCLVSCATRDGVTLVCVTLNAPNDWNDHAKLLDYGFDQYESINLCSPERYVVKLSLINGKKDSIIAKSYDQLDVTLKKERVNISAHLEYDRLLSAPIRKGDTVGKIVFKNNGKEIGTVSLLAIEDVQSVNYKKSIFERITDKWKK